MELKRSCEECEFFEYTRKSLDGSKYFDGRCKATKKKLSTSEIKELKYCKYRGKGQLKKQYGVLKGIMDLVK